MEMNREQLLKVLDGEEVYVDYLGVHVLCDNGKLYAFGKEIETTMGTLEIMYHKVAEEALREAQLIE